MKKIFIVLLFVNVSILSRSQNIERNLKLAGFNSFDTSVIGPIGGLTITRSFTVPQNKIWKAEVWVVSGKTFAYINDIYWPFYASNGSNYSLGTLYSIDKPIWLKSGDTIKFKTTSSDLGYHFSYFEYFLE
jgi:hypothetical protein